MSKKALTQEEREKISEIIRDDLVSRFGGEFVFDPIVSEMDVNYDGEDYIQIWIVFDGDQARLDPQWTYGLITRIRPKLIDCGLPYFPSPGFVEKSEWLDFRKRYRSALK